MIDKKVGDILLRSCTSSFSPNRHAIELGSMSMSMQSYNQLTGVHVVEISNENKETTKICFYRVLCAIRLMKSGAEEEERETEFEVKAEFDAPFEASMDVTQQELESNCDNPDIMSSIWPHWKELVHSLCLRSGIKPLKIADFTPLRRSKFNPVD